MSDKNLKDVAYSGKDTVLYRMSPSQKERFVKCCKHKDTIIAVTGDVGLGLSDSDSPVISISMGLSGTDISKQSADIVLLDDDFASIVSGIEEGRVIYDNLKKSICYTLSSKTPEVLPFLMFILLDIPLALGVVTILCIDLGTDMFPAIALAYETPETGIMSREPIDLVKQGLFDGRLMLMAYCFFGAFQAMASFFTYLVIMTENGYFAFDLLGVRKQWNSKAINDLIDSCGQEWVCL